MSKFYETRTTAIRGFFGPLSVEDWPLYRSNLWYSSEHNKCLAYEPEESARDESYSALSRATIYAALFGQQPGVP